MSATNAFETAVLALYFNATTHDGFAENDSTSPWTAYYVSLHTADPGEAGSQNTSETAYIGYARISVNRNSGGFTVSGNNVSNAVEIAFGQCSASPGSNLTYFGIGTDVSGAGTLLFSGALTDPITMQVGTTPIFSIGELDVNCD